MSHDERQGDTPDTTVEPDREARAAAERKERVLHTRIPAQLEDEIKRLADALRVPVSNLVRNILEDAVGMVENLRDNVGETVSELRHDVSAISSHMARERDHIRRRWAAYQAWRRGAPEPPAPPAPPAPEVLGWQPLILATAATCGRCGRAIAAGESAFHGITDRPGRPSFICPACLPGPAGERRNQ